MSSYRWYALKAAADSQVDIGGFFPGDKLGTPASVSSLPQQAFLWTAGLTTNISTNTTNDLHYSFLRNYWQWKRAGDPMQTATLGGALEIDSGQSAGFGQVNDLGPYNVDTQNTRNRFWDGHDQMLRDDVSMLKGNHLFTFGGTYEHNWDYHQRTDNGGGINNQVVYELGNGTSGSGLAQDIPLCSQAGVTITGCSSLSAAALGVVSIAQVAYTRSGANLALNPVGSPAFDKSTIPYYNVYFSDSWHMKPTFTLTYGLGWTLANVRRCRVKTTIPKSVLPCWAIPLMDRSILITRSTAHSARAWLRPGAPTSTVIPQWVIFSAMKIRWFGLAMAASLAA